MSEANHRQASAGRVEQLSSGATRIVEVQGRRVLLARWGNQVFACAPVCPHRGNPLEPARVWEFQLVCPWHQYRYDLRTGENVYPGDVRPPGVGDADQDRVQGDVRRLPTYPVELRDGEIFIELPDR